MALTSGDVEVTIVGMGGKVCPLTDQGRLCERKVIGVTALVHQVT